MIQIASFIFSIVLSIIGIYSIWQYIRQKRFDEKLRVYKNFLEIIADSTLNQDDQEKKDVRIRYILAKQELILFAPVEIVEKISEIGPINFSNTFEGNQRYNLYLELLNLMRKDLKYLNKTISPEVLKKLL